MNKLDIHIDTGMEENSPEPNTFYKERRLLCVLGSISIHVFALLTLLKSN